MSMKFGKRSIDGEGKSEPSVLDYFSKARRKKSTTSLNFGTPATPATDVIDDDNAADLHYHDAKLIPVKDAARREGTPSSWATPATAMSGATPDTREPTTPPSTDSDTPNQLKSNNHHAGALTAMRSTRLSSETPPSNNACMSTTPPSPQSADATWKGCPVDQKENKSNVNKGTQRTADGDAGAPKSLLDGKYETRRKTGSSIHMGTPSTACTPSTQSSSSVTSQANNFFRKYISSNKSCKGRKGSKRGSISGTSISKQGTTNNRRTKKQRQPANQLFLDFGQSSFGKQTLCSICGMLRVHGMDEDDAQHTRVCKDYKEGVSCLGWKNERVVGTSERNGRILEVRPDDPPQHRKKVTEVKKIVDKELGFARRNHDDAVSDDDLGEMTSYLYVCNKRVVGLLMTKRVQRAYALIPNERENVQHERDNGNNAGDATTSISRSLKPSKALMGVHQIWVHSAHRTRGIASKLVTAARDHYIFGMVVPAELVAFSSPTDEGLRFAKKYVGTETPLIYDIR